jgi:uncharacterized protein (TIGR02246 family)
MRVHLPAAGVALVIGLAIAGVHAEPMQPRADDEREIRRLIASHAVASQKADLRGLLSVYHADADVRYSDGTVLRGRAELEKSYREALSGDPNGVAHSHPAETIHIRFLRPDVAFVDVEAVAGGGAGRAGATEAVSRTPLFVLFTKDQGRWGVAVQRSGVQLK